MFIISGCGGGGSTVYLTSDDSSSNTYGYVSATTDSSGKATITSSSLGVTYEILAVDSSLNPVSGVTVVYSEVDGKSVIYIKDSSGIYEDVVLIGTPSELSTAAPRFLSKTYAKSTGYNLGVTLQKRTASAVGFTSNAYDLHKVYMSTGTGTDWRTDCYTTSELITELQGMSTSKEAVISFRGDVSDSDIQYIKLSGSWFSNSGFSTAMQTRLKAVYGLDSSSLPLANFQMTCYEPTSGALYDGGIGTICGITKSSSVCQPNNAPEISGIPTTYQKAGTYSFTPSATDADNDTLTWSIANKPDWATFNESTGALTGTATAGIYEGITITVSDGTSIASKTFDLTIVTWILTKTGQTSCWDGSGTALSAAECLISGQDGSYQMGADPSLTRDNTTYTVTDNLNGLMWQDDASPTSSWSNAPAVCTALNTSSYGGYDNGWRLPTIEELESIVDFGQSFPAINTIFQNTGSGEYWSSNTYLADTDYALVVIFRSGVSYYYNSNTYVRCVRGDSYPSEAFVRDSTKQVVTDKRTGLMWQDDAVSPTLTWSGTINYCMDKSLGGYSDWRLPNQRELLSIANRNLLNHAINLVFTNTASGAYWSSTTDITTTDAAWFVGFYDGISSSDYKSSSYYVRCVRGGQ
ncbi:MAG: DUF1566 domain-containing protein [Deferribacterales bacterium]